MKQKIQKTIQVSQENLEKLQYMLPSGDLLENKINQLTILNSR